MCTVLHEDMMCLVPVAVTEHQSLFKAAEQAGGSLDLVCYTCFCNFTAIPRLYRGAIQMFMRVLQNLDFQSGLKYLKGTEKISADVRSAEIETFHFMCLLCMTYLLIHCYFSYLLWPSEGLMFSDLGSASAIKNSLALSYFLGGGSWIDGKSSLIAAVWPHEGYLWLLLAQGSAVMTLHDLWQEVFITRGMQMAGGMSNTLRLLKKTLSGVGRICESTRVCAGTQALPHLPFHPADEILMVLMFVAFIDSVCKEINASQNPDMWLVGWQRMVEAYVAERREGGSTGRSHWPVILGHIFLRTNLLNVRAFLSAFTCCFWVSRCIWICEYEFTLLFLCSITSCSLSLSSALWRTQRLCVWGVTQPVALCLFLSAEQTNRWWQGGL